MKYEKGQFTRSGVSQLEEIHIMEIGLILLSNFMATLHNIINNHCQNTLLFDNLVIRNYQRVVAGLASNLPMNFGTQSLWT